jgi:hypothetical protein
MAKLLVTTFSVLILAFSSMILVNAPQSAADVETDNNFSSYLPSAVIDGIEVPYEVLLYVQDEYPGHAVIQAREVTRGGSEAYRLLVSRDDIASNSDGFYLLYDKDWELLGDEALPPPPEPNVEPEAAPEPQPQEEDNDSAPESDPRGGASPSPGPNSSNQPNGSSDDNNENEDDNSTEGLEGEAD